ncbi:hypothetical protein [Candidatus Pelagibacter bacterium nBUS_32]|uniref:hypothetical protein n=1 Tax=Candidatus Pelagibacter bacterium nBUS_32 TaxID=3374192 RepID=UPI003EBB9CEE
MNKFLFLANYLKYFFFTLISNISPNNNFRQNLLAFIKSFFINAMYSYKNIFKPNNNIKYNFRSGSYWDNCLNHLNFVAKYFDEDNIFKSLVLNLTVLNIQKNINKINLENDFFKNQKLKKYSNLIFNKFKNLKIENILQWYGSFVYSMSDNVLDNELINITKKTSVVEIGPGLGLTSLIYSDLNSKDIFFYDLLEMTLIQKRLENKIKSSHRINKINYFNNLIDLKEELNTMDYYIVSMYAFSEFPVILRESFDNIIKQSKFSLFLSNENFENVKNEDYFKDLAIRINRKLKVKEFDYSARLGFANKHKYFIIYD